MKTIVKSLLDQPSIIRQSERIIDILNLPHHEQMEYLSKLEWSKEEIFVFSNLAIDHGFETIPIDIPFLFDIHEEFFLSQSIRKRHHVYGKAFKKGDQIIMFYAKVQDLKKGNHYFWSGRNLDRAIDLLGKGAYPLEN